MIVVPFRTIRERRNCARQLMQLVQRWNSTSRLDPNCCAIAAYRGSWDRPDIGFADAVRATVDEAMREH